jgi:glutathione S-transferase
MTSDTSSKFYYSNGSVYAYIGALFIYEKGIEKEFEFVPITMGQDNIAPWYIKLNPKGQVPTLVHKGKPIPDSFDIGIYLDKAFPPTNYATHDPEAVAFVEKWRQLRALALLAGRKTPTQDITQLEETLKNLKEQALVYAKENPDLDYTTRLANHEMRALSLVDHDTYLAHKDMAEALLKETDALLENRDTILPQGRTIADVYVVGFFYWMTRRLDPEFLAQFKNVNRFFKKESAKDTFVRAFESKW